MYIKNEIINAIVIEKSEFIAYIKAIFNDEEFKDYLKDIKKKHYDASHICYGLICQNLKKSNDDNEPTGTAGKPILYCLEMNNLDNTCCIYRHLSINNNILNLCSY